MDKEREAYKTVLGAVKVTKAYILQNLIELAKVKDEFSDYEKSNLSKNLTITLQVLQGIESGLENFKKGDIQ